ncbi:heme biosynthesis protein HemY [Desertibaculum subflavum]|uniref:heme biosynthesis protein HemY n=1 Tax=Desertibaculum subflavum TaxID=2268458 RepID=UPI000E6721AD
MIRLVLAVVVMLALSLAAAWLADRPGRLVLDWSGWRFETSVAAILAVLVVLTVLAALLHRIWLWLRDRPGALGRFRDRGRRRKGLEALTRGLVAAAAGDTRDAVRLAESAGRLLDEPALKLLLAAQSAQMTGDDVRAERAFNMMLERPDTEFLGRRGLLVLARRRQDLGAALAHARRAHALRPGTAWVLTELIDLEAAAGNFPAAADAAAQAERRGVLPGPEAARLQATALVELARRAEAEGDAKEALRASLRAHELVADFTPAVTLAARLLLARGKRRRATRLLTDAWAAAPHPDIAEAYLDLEPEAAPERRRVRAQELAALRPDDPESRLLLARAALAAGDLKAARNEIAPLAGEQAEPRVCRLMAEIDEAEYGDAASARDWLRRAANAPIRAAWRCTSCGFATPAWSAFCPACAAFGAVGWSLQAPAAMRPPLVTLGAVPLPLHGPAALPPVRGG